MAADADDESEAPAAGAAAGLPSGTISVGVGLIVLGVSAYVFLTLSAHALAPERFSSLSVLWVAVYTVGPGLFLPLEQEVARALAERRARGVGGAPVFRRAATLGLGLAGALLVLSLATSPAYLSVLFDGSKTMFVALLLSMLALWSAHLCRGVLAGAGEFRNYGTMLGVEGMARVVGCIVLFAAAVHWAPAYGLLLPAGLIASVLVVARRARTAITPGPTASWNELSEALGWLLATALLSQLLVNVGPLAVKALASANEHNQAGQFLAGSVLVRVPLFLFSAVQAALLPGLASLATRGAYKEFGTRLMRLLLLLGAVGVVGTVGAALVGPELLKLFFGPKFHLGTRILTELAFANSVYMMTVVLGQALIALRRYVAVAAGWASGVVAFFACLGLHGSILDRAAHGFVAGTVVATVVLALLVRRAMQAASSIDPAPLTYSAYGLFEE
jgi:O-antigen/teichoic acid export membrane protein